jgi:signal transduction histidine kinase
MAGNLYRIAQEAIHNAARHGKARRVAVRLAENRGRITLTVADDGKGIPQASIDAVGGGGMGIRIMRSRANVLGAAIDIRRRGVRGTIVTCSFRPDRRTP